MKLNEPKFPPTRILRNSHKNETRTFQLLYFFMPYLYGSRCGLPVGFFLKITDQLARIFFLLPTGSKQTVFKIRGIKI